MKAEREGFEANLGGLGLYRPYLAITSKEPETPAFRDKSGFV
jgi:hypothetical protein